MYETAELTGKLHIQGVIQPTKSASQFRRDLQLSYKGFFTRSNYSIAPVRKQDNYLAYICKERTPFVNNMITSEQVEELYKKYWDYNKQVVAPRIRKLKAKTWSQELTERINKKYPDQIWLYTGYVTKLIGDEVLDALGETSKKVSSHIYRDLTLGQLNALNPSSGLKAKFHQDAFPEFHNGSNGYH